MQNKTALDYLDLMERRKYPFRVVQAALRDSDLPSAQGWDPLKEKYKLSANAKLATTVATLSEINHGLMMYTEKAIALFPVEPKYAKKLAGLLSQGLVTGNAYTAKYPFVLDSVTLHTQRSKLQVAAAEPGLAAEQILLAGKLYETERTPFGVGDFTVVPSELAGYDEVIAIRRTARQLFHIVTLRTLPTGQFVEVRLDILGHMLADDFKKHLNAVVKWVNDLFHQAYSATVIEAHVNMHAAIEPLYQSPDGKIRQLGAATTTASIKQERMRNKSDDLRKEKYHIAGSKAVAWDGFSIEKNWDATQGSSTPALGIPGKISDASGSADVPMAFITGASGASDYEMVFNRLITALSL